MKYNIFSFIRLDFDNFVLAQPETTDHQCQDDQFIVSGGSPIPAICGTNSGAHSKMRYKLLLFLPLFQF